VCLEALWISFDGAAVKPGGVIELISGIGDVARVEQGTRIVRVVLEPGSQFRCRGRPVRFDDEGFGVDHFAGRGVRRCVRSLCAEYGRGK